MPELTIYPGTHQIGGCCTELTCGGERIIVDPVPDGKLKDDGFVMLVRKNTDPDRKSLFEEIRDEFYPLDGQIICSMWDGYLKPEHADQALIDFIGGHPLSGCAPAATPTRKLSQS